MFRTLRPDLPTFVVPAALVTIVTLVLGIANNSVLVSVVISALINLTLVLGTYIFSGNSGVVSFGQLSFMMIGAYSSALVSIPTASKKLFLPHLMPFVQNLQVGFVPSVIIGAAVAGFAAFLVGFPLARLSGIQAGIASLALLLVVQTVASHWDDVTNGAQTMIGIPADLSIWEALIFALIAMVIAFAYQRSKWGLRMKASREDELAAAAAGIVVSRERHLAFTLSGIVCGVGGALSAHYLGSLSSTLDSLFTPTYLTIAMLVIGGLFSLNGAVVGTIFVSVIDELLRRVEQGVQIGSATLAAPAGLDEVILGVILLVTLRIRPSGLTRSVEASYPTKQALQRILRRRPAVPTVSADPQ